MKIDGWKIKKKIRELGLTQQDLANKTGLARSCVTLVLNGKPCRQTTAEKIAEAVGLPVDKIILKR